MLALDKVVAGANIRGVAGPSIVEVVRVQWIGSDALNIVYQGADGPAEVLLYREAEARLELIQASRAFSFGGDGDAFRVASEAQRIRLRFFNARVICRHNAVASFRYVEARVSRCPVNVSRLSFAAELVEYGNELIAPKDTQTID
jgi:hypothetical protein